MHPFLLSDLTYDYPEHLVATQPSRALRCMWFEDQPSALLSSTKSTHPQAKTDGSKTFEPCELNKSELLKKFKPRDVLVINDTKVVKRRVFSLCGREILFVKSLPENHWQVLFPVRGLKVGEVLRLPQDLAVKLVQKGLPQVVELSRAVDESYFSAYGELALPPYIQKARGERHNLKEEELWYQTQWAEKQGSSAAPTASLHFSQEDLVYLQAQGVQVCPLTLHVGLGTFLPIKTPDVRDHKIHSESVFIPQATIDAIDHCHKSGGRVWALGTTVTRALESWAAGRLELDAAGNFSGESELFILPGFDFKVVDVLMTNFHQPQSTLLALVCAFAGHKNVLAAYSWAIKREFKLFSYGDLSVWQRIK